MPEKSQKKKRLLPPPDPGQATAPRRLPPGWLLGPVLLYGLFLLFYAWLFEERLPIWPEMVIPLLVLVPIALYLLSESSRSG